MITLDYICPFVDGACRYSACEQTYRVHLVDFAADGTSARATELAAGPPPDSGDFYGCSDAIPIDLGPAGPDGEPNAGRDELVLSCVVLFANRDENGVVERDDETYLPTYGEPESALVAFHSRTEGPAGAFPMTPTPWFGDLAAGDVTGDGLDDVILMFFGIAGVAVQCPRHDAAKCEL